MKPNDDDEDFRAGWGPGKSNGKKSNKEPASTEIKSEEEEDARFYGSGLDEEHQKIWDIVDAGEEVRIWRMGRVYLRNSDQFCDTSAGSSNHRSANPQEDCVEV